MMPNAMRYQAKGVKSWLEMKRNNQRTQRKAETKAEMERLEAELVRRAQAKDELAFREIVERYQAKVYSIIFGMTASVRPPPRS